MKRKAKGFTITWDDSDPEDDNKPETEPDSGNFFAFIASVHDDASLVLPETGSLGESDDSAKFDEIESDADEKGDLQHVYD